MANKTLKTIKFPGLPDVYEIPPVPDYESLDLALDMVAELGFGEPVTDENGAIFTDETNNILIF